MKTVLLKVTGIDGKDFETTVSKHDTVCVSELLQELRDLTTDAPAADLDTIIKGLNFLVKERPEYAQNAVTAIGNVSKVWHSIATHREALNSFSNELERIISVI